MNEFTPLLLSSFSVGLTDKEQLWDDPRLEVTCSPPVSVGNIKTFTVCVYKVVGQTQAFIDVYVRSIPTVHYSAEICELT